MTSAQARGLRGKTIRCVRLNTTRVKYEDGSPGGTMHEPEIVLTDGTVIRFMAQENPGGGDYGVDIIWPGRPYRKGETA